jgi:hypothetical protein
VIQRNLASPATLALGHYPLGMDQTVRIDQKLWAAAGKLFHRLNISFFETVNKSVVNKLCTWFFEGFYAVDGEFAAFLW